VSIGLGGEGDDAVLQRANRCKSWQCWVYTAASDRLVLYGRYNDSPAFPHAGGYLVFRSPRAARLLMTMKDARLSLDSPGSGPAGRLAGPNRVIIHSERRELHVDCQSLAFYPQDTWQLPGNPDWVHNTDWVGQLPGAAPHLRSLDGADMEWWTLLPGHQYFRILARGPSQRLTEIRLLGTDYLELPTRMRQVHIRPADPLETRALRPLLSERIGEHLRPEEHLVFTYEGGTGCLVAGMAAFKAVREPEPESLAGLSGPLWKDGPPLAEL
jgi:hypothetical protein